MTLLAFLAAATGLSMPELSLPVLEYSCSALVKSPEGSSQVVEDATLTVLAEAESETPFQYSRADTQAIRCLRSSIIPAASDRRVLKAGYPLYLVDEAMGANRVGVLEIVGGQYRFRMVSGELTAGEKESLLRQLNAMQLASRSS